MEEAGAVAGDRIAKGSTRAARAAERSLTAGDLLIIGLPGPDLDAEAQALLEEVRPLGVILFRRNILRSPSSAT
jgi:beta-glucosidase-like glycosyl hydrolase